MQRVSGGVMLLVLTASVLSSVSTQAQFAGSSALQVPPRPD
jgi:hypothetical protein